MAGNDLNIEMGRNDSWLRTVVVDDAQDGVTPTDVTQDFFSLQVRPAPGSSTILGYGTITKSDPLQGELQVFLDGTDFALLDGVSEIITLAYDMVRTYPDGIKEVMLRGTIYLQPQVTI